MYAKPRLQFGKNHSFEYTFKYIFHTAIRTTDTRSQKQEHLKDCSPGKQNHDYSLDLYEYVQSYNTWTEKSRK